MLVSWEKFSRVYFSTSIYRDVLILRWQFAICNRYFYGNGGHVVYSVGFYANGGHVVYLMRYYRNSGHVVYSVSYYSNGGHVVYLTNCDRDIIIKLFYLMS